jgi:hypothetical protein
MSAAASVTNPGSRKENIEFLVRASSLKDNCLLCETKVASSANRAITVIMLFFGTSDKLSENESI